MKVIPVLDLLGGKVVHGVKGQREKYKPIESKLIDSSRPLDVARAFKDKLGLNEFYIADLDSIKGQKDNLESIEAIRNSLGSSIMLDPGIQSKQDLRESRLSPADDLIIATETLESFEILKEAKKVKGKENLIVSIDMKDMELISKVTSKEKPIEIVREFVKRGIEKFILLDLKKVGSMQGPSREIRKIAVNLPDSLELITGGGIRSKKDIDRLNRAGFDGVLIATSLHNGNIERKDIEQIS